MKHVLVVAFHFPPESSSSGVLRTSKFVRYLLDFGWRVTVLTIDRGAYAQTDESLLADIPPSVRVIRTPYRQWHKLFRVGRWYPSLVAIPDIWAGWFPHAVRAGLELCASDPVDAVYSTSPHATAHLIARHIALKQRVPYVVDLRDPWYEVPPEQGTTWLVSKASQWLEWAVVRRASAVISTTPEFCRTLRERYPGLPGGRFVSVPNGYDEADFRHLGPPGPAATGRLAIVHTGNINPLFRDPRPLLDALGRQVRAGRVGAAELSLQFLGPGDYSRDASLRECIERNGLKASVEFRERVPYSECVRIMSESGLLLLLQASADTVTLVPTKLYEYLRIGRPILALVWAGSLATVLGDVGGGWSCDPGRTEDLDQCVGAIVDAWRQGRLQEHASQSERIRCYERRELTRGLAGLLDGATAGAADD